MFMTLAVGAHALGSIIVGFNQILRAALLLLQTVTKRFQTKWKCIFIKMRCKTGNLSLCEQFIWRKQKIYKNCFVHLICWRFFSACDIIFCRISRCCYRCGSCCLFVISVRYFSSWINACNNITSEYLSSHLIIILFYFSCLNFSRWFLRFYSRHHRFVCFEYQRH